MSENVNINLKKSVRFLAAYNQKLLAAYRKIVAAIDSDEYGIYFESTNFSWPSQKISQDNWTWDFLPLAFPRLTCTKGEPNTPPYSVIFVEHITDTGILPFEGDFEPSPFHLKNIEESATIWAMRYFSANKRAIRIDKDEWEADDYPIFLKGIFGDENVWSYDFVKCAEFEIEKNNMKYGHFLFDANEVMSFENFDLKILKLAERLAKELAS